MIYTQIFRGDDITCHGKLQSESIRIELILNTNRSSLLRVILTHLNNWVHAEENNDQIHQVVSHIFSIYLPYVLCITEIGMTYVSRLQSEHVMHI